MITFAYMIADKQPHIFSLDYERSLRAAFLQEEFVAAARTNLPDTVRTYSTAIVPLLVIMRTAPRGIPKEAAAKLDTLKKALPSRYRADLDDLRLFFRQGGLAGDPFKLV